jgi:hypothetical protein
MAHKKTSWSLLRKDQQWHRFAFLVAGGLLDSLSQTAWDAVRLQQVINVTRVELIRLR